MAKDEKWIQGAIKRPGALTEKAEKAGMTVKEYTAKVKANPEKYDERTRRQANLARTLSKLRKKKASK
jgi:hypothetical protein